MSGDAVAQFNIHDAKTHLSQIIERVEHGEEITPRLLARHSRRSASSAAHRPGRFAHSS